MAATYPPISPQGVVFTVRKFLRALYNRRVLERGGIDAESLAVIVARCKAGKRSLFWWHVHGKTTMVNGSPVTFRHMSAL